MRQNARVEDVAQDFRVSITATGADPRDNISYVHAISVAQPVQSWTVIREHAEFMNVANSLKQLMPGLPPCPTGAGDAEQVREQLQHWLSNILHFPGVRESPNIRHFLCFGANAVPPHFEHVNWITFGDSSTGSNNNMQAGNFNSGGRAHSLDEMEMDDMFDTGGGDSDCDESDEEDELDDELLPYAARYPPVDETVTKDDVMDLNDSEVEMVDDIGSLAQSLGASHLGRSLQLQAQIANMKQIQQQQNGTTTHIAQGVTLGAAPLAPVNGAGGGIGGAMENADMERRIEGLGDSFLQVKPTSAPRLDSFKMIKVIGKGSFGK